MAGRRHRHVARTLRKPGTTKATRSVANVAQAPCGGGTDPRAARLQRRSGFTAVTRSVAAQRT